MFKSKMKKIVLSVTMMATMMAMAAPAAMAAGCGVSGCVSTCYSSPWLCRSHSRTTTFYPNGQTKVVVRCNNHPSYM